jgi:hypothetical protein
VRERDFCLGCGRPLPRNGRQLDCPCGLHPEQLRELEQREQQHLAIYCQARLLTTQDFLRPVHTAQGPRLVRDILDFPASDHIIRECSLRASETELLQLVYVCGKGSLLLRWTFCG